LVGAEGLEPPTYAL